MKHRATEFRCKRTCQTCKSKHLRLYKQSSAMMEATEESVLYPVVVVKENNIISRALLDTGTGSSYESSTLLEKKWKYSQLEKKSNGLIVELERLMCLKLESKFREILEEVSRLNQNQAKLIVKRCYHFLIQTKKQF